MKKHLKIALLVLFMASVKLFAQQVTEINPELLSRPWTAKWIAYPDISGSEYAGPE